MTDYEDKAKGMFIGHTHCVKCGSSDALALYKQEDDTVNGTCYSCESFIPSEEIPEGMGNGVPYQEPIRNFITKEELERVIKHTTFRSGKYRGIPDSVCKFTGIRTQWKNGKVYARFYPAHFEGELVGYKRRIHPKDFTKGPIGYAKNDCDLLGQNVHKRGGKYLLICGGEEDYAASVAMLRAYQKSKGQDHYDPIAVVTGITGEGGIKKQVQKAYDYINSFDRIIVGLDMDSAGEKATKALIKVLPQSKVYVAEWPANDPNECLQEGLQGKFVQAFFNAEKHTPSGILTSADLFEHLLERAKIPRIPLPPFMKKVETMLCGGIPLGYIVNILSASGTGKTTIVNELLYYWLFHCPHKTGVVSLEATAGEYYTYILSRHLGRKIELIPTPEEKIEYLTSPEVRAKEMELRYGEDGEPRFYLLDDRGDIKTLKDKMEHLIVGCGCKILIVDPLQDILDEITTEEEAKFMRWQKQMIQLHEITFININHARKSQGGAKANSRGAELNEEDMQGSSSIFKSGAINIIITRDKMAEDDIERNTLKVSITKARGVGNTGPAGEMYYENKTHTLHDKDVYFSGRLPDKPVQQTAPPLGSLPPEFDGGYEEGDTPFR